MIGTNTKYQVDLDEIAERFFEGFRVDAAEYVWKNQILFNDDFAEYCFHYWIKYSESIDGEEI